MYYNNTLFYKFAYQIRLIMSNTRSGEMVSPQIANMGTIADLTTKNFKLSDGNVFQVNNDSFAPVTLEVKLASMSDEDDFVSTSFAVGWNPEIVREIKANASHTNVSLKWGY